MNKNVALLFILLLIGFLLAWPITVLVEQLRKEPELKQLGELEQLAEDFLQATREGDYDRSQRQIAKIAELFPNLTLPVTIRIESLNAITQSILAARQMFASSHVNEEKLLWHATQVRIAIDALHHKHQPIWKSYYPSMSKQLQHLYKAAAERDLTVLREQLAEQYQLYLAIRPAMSIQTKLPHIYAMDAAYEQLSKEMRSETPDWQVVHDTLQRLSTVVQEVFLGEERSALGGLWVAGSPFALITSVAVVVLLPLVYVGWKKYTARLSG